MMHQGLLTPPEERHISPHFVDDDEEGDACSGDSVACAQNPLSELSGRDTDLQVKLADGQCLEDVCNRNAGKDAT